MPESRADIARRFMELCARGDHEPALALADPGIVWNPTQENAAEGAEAVEATMRRWGESFEDLTVRFEEVAEAGDRLLVKASFSGRGRGSGIELDQTSYMLWTIRDGRVLRMDEFDRRAEALEAARDQG